LALANAQNKEVDPKAASNQSQADLFSRQLQSRLLSALSSQITEAIFGENPQERGTITFGGQTISFVRSLDNGSLTITNNETGEVTNIVIPTFIEVN
jgi:curli production assembly/transport component CsgF